MSYLIRADYNALIQTDNLNQIIGSKQAILDQIESVAQQEIISYLRQKYNVDKEFTDTNLYAYNVATFNAKDRVYLDATAYSATATYALNTLVTYNSKVYRCSTAVTVAEAFNAAKWTLLGDQYQIFNVTTPKNDWDYYTEYSTGDEVFYENKTYTAVVGSTGIIPSSSPAIWGTGTAYTIPAATWVTDTAKWTAGDNRTSQLVAYMIDIVLYHVHSRIAPMNIPDLRVKRYDDAIKWLKSCAQGDFITSNIPLIQPRSGKRIRWGSLNEKNNNNY